MAVVARASGLAGSAQGASSTAEFYFDDNTGVDAIVALPVDQVCKVHNLTGSRAGLAADTASDLDTISLRPFKVRAGGIVIGSAATNFTINLDAGDSTTPGSNTTIGTSGTPALDTDGTLTTWYIEANLILAPGTTSKLQGRYSGWVNNTATATAVAVESVEDLLSSGVLYFKVSGTFSASDANNGAVCNFLEVVMD